MLKCFYFIVYIQLPGFWLVAMIAGMEGVEKEVFVRISVAPMATAVGVGSMIVPVKPSKLL